MPVSDAQVRDLIDLPADRSTDAFICAAELIVSEDLGISGLSQARLNLISTYLAAHFAAITDERGGLKSSETLNAKDEYFGNYGKGLSSTRYGQQAITLDTSGSLAAIAEIAPKARFGVV